MNYSDRLFLRAFVRYVRFFPPPPPFLYAFVPRKSLSSLSSIAIVLSRSPSIYSSIDFAASYPIVIRIFCHRYFFPKLNS